VEREETAMRKRNLVWIPYTLAVASSYVGAFLLRSDFTLPRGDSMFLWGMAAVILLKLPVFWLFRLHCANFRQVSLCDLVRTAAACTAATLLVALVFTTYFPPSIYILDCLLSIIFVGCVQLSVRLFREVLLPNAKAGGNKRNVLIYGAGVAGAQLSKELRSHPALGAAAVGYLDDDDAKYGSTVMGLPVLGRGRDAAAIVARYARRNQPISEIVLAIPSATGNEMRSAVANCRAAGIQVRTLPSIAELLEGKVVRQIREVEPEDLLGRDPVQIEESRIEEVVTGKSVLVTGGCGSIGSEICRQVARFKPRTLVVLDQAESEAFMLAMSLRGRFPGLNLAIEIGDVASPQRVDEVMHRYELDVVFHAAAYKHVPLMEEHVAEAVTNNVIGTYNVAMAAHRHSVSRFVLISTDKAVNPTSVMGLTKRVAELLVSGMPLDGSARRTRFMSVRFGNVLGSSGSVVQVFRRQIAAGGPVTITHPDMRRYFMSITEAVQLVLQASVMGAGSEVFVLDMGEPVLIMDLAKNMIRLAGFTPGEDIEIRTTGLRPGEKLFEEIHLQDENHLQTEHAKIARFSSRMLRPAFLADWMEELQIQLRRRNTEALIAHMQVLVPEYLGDRARREQPASQNVPVSAPAMG
jgi:FlaA1/EpsC-like NDP-sugar epimerase